MFLFALESKFQRFVFENKWLYNDNEVPIDCSTKPENWPEDEDFLIGWPINVEFSLPEDREIILTPVFEGVTASYTITVKNQQGSEVPQTWTKQFDYGTTFQTVVEAFMTYSDNAEVDERTEVPYFNGADCEWNEIYDFIGYSLTPNGTLVNTDIKVTGDRTLYTVFEKKSVSEAQAHPEYFHFSDIYGTPTEEGAEPPCIGCAVRLKKGVEVRGKIIVPSYKPEHSDIHVIKIDSDYYSTSISSNTSNIQASRDKITHVFLKDKSQLQEIGKMAFRNWSQLEYFDFDLSGDSQLQLIGQQSFVYTSLKPNGTAADNSPAFYLPNSVTLIGRLAFGYALRWKETGYVYIPSSVIQMNNACFSYFSSPMHFVIGSENSDSILQVEKMEIIEIKEGEMDINSILLGDTIKNIGNITFYSNTYTQWDSGLPVGTTGNTRTVADWFNRNQQHVNADSTWTLYGPNNSKDVLIINSTSNQEGG